MSENKDYIGSLVARVVALFGRYDREDCKAIADLLTRWRVEHSMLRTGNATDHKEKSVVKGDAQQRVSLDTMEDGTPVIILQRMAGLIKDETPHRHLYASAIHGALLAWRKENATPDDKGRLRLIDKEFTSLASEIGLRKVAEENADGKKIGDNNRRVWYGLSLDRQQEADAWAEEVGDLPPSFIGTELKPIEFNTLMIPCTVTFADGTTCEDFFFRTPSHKADPKACVDHFKARLELAGVSFTEKQRKNAKHQFLLSEMERLDGNTNAAELAQAEDLAAAIEANAQEDASPRLSKRDRKRQRRAEASA